MSEGGIFINQGGWKPQIVNFKRANRHGLIADATGAGTGTGTGKSVTLEDLVKVFSKVGAPTFLARVKSDLEGRDMTVSAQSELHENLAVHGVTVGEDLVSLLQADRSPDPVEPMLYKPPTAHANRSATIESAGIAAGQVATRAGMMGRIIVSATRSALLSICRQVAGERGLKGFGGSCPHADSSDERWGGSRRNMLGIC